MALMLTELSLETTAEALILSRDDELIDYRGRLPRAEVEQLKDLLFAPWNENQKTRINFPRLESVATDFMLYSMRTTDNLVLSLLFAGVMPFSAIRRQGKKLADALNAVPDTPATETIPEPPTSSLQAPETPAVPAAETPALETLLEPADESGSEPSGAVPATIRLEPLISEEEVDTTPGDDEEEEGPVVPAPQPGEDPTIAARDDAGVELEEDSAQAPAAPEETALATEAYNFVWLLRDNTLTLTNEAAESVVSTLNKRLSQDGWRIRNLDVYGDFIYLRADVPTTQPANRAVRDAMQYSAEILQTAQSTWDDSIWADSYLVVPAERELTIKEIQNFLAFARN
jgi:REP element-mobilizing transposase RayT